MKCPCCKDIDLRATPASIAPFIVARTGCKPDCYTMQCLKCGFIFSSTRFTDEQMKRLYSDYRGAEYVSLREQFEPGYTKRNDKLLQPCAWVGKIEKIIKRNFGVPSSVLDWGGDTGLNSPFRDCKTLHIYDIGDKPMQYGKRVKRPNKYYDIISCASVLEHLPYPNRTVKKISKIDHGVIYFDVPTETQPRRVWHEHINVFNLSSLTVLLNGCGLKILEHHYLTNPSMLQVVCK